MRNTGKLVYGIGVNDFEGSISINGKNIKSYKVWHEIFVRCYSEKLHKRQPTYKDCTVCEEWKSYSNFRQWFYDNYRYDLEELGIRVELDKDLLVEGNKIYSPETCIFLPKSVNSFMTNKKRSNTSGVTGVNKKKGINKWVAQINDIEGHRKHLGYFTNLEDAKLAYQHGRALRVLEIQEQMRDCNYSEDIIKLIK